MLNRMETGFIALVALLHMYFCYVEVFKWTDPKVAEGFGLTLEAAQLSSVLAGNQGIYNLMLALGLVWALTLKERGKELLRYILVFVVVVGIYGAATASPKILFIQAIPAALAYGVHALRLMRLKTNRAAGLVT